MRYFLAIFALALIAVLSVAGFRGSSSRRPPLEVFSDMDRQPKIRPQTRDEFFADRFGSRLPVEGTIARSQPLEVAGQSVYPFEEHPVNTGRVAGTTNYVELSPLRPSAALLARGQERYQIHCLPCHGPQGDGKGITPKYGMVVIGNLHDPRMVRLPDGELYHTLTYGKNLMQGYGANLSVRDRWAILAYVRALQLSHLATLDDVPAEHRSALQP
ncbi:MAG: cytochrome c [Verrucomicrobia bacterium]|nr:cytochrome c [Verrucomicrobiota bacterium]